MRAPLRFFSSRMRSPAFEQRLLIADGAALAAACDLHAEEKRTGIFNVSEVCYPTLARNLRARRNNLSITMLQSVARHSPQRDLPG